MKKIIALIMSVVYLTASSGVVLNVHYCMGKLASVKVDHFKSDYCLKCGMKANKGCCHDELKVVKLDKAHKQTATVVTVAAPLAVFAISSKTAVYKLEEANTDRILPDNRPPPLSPDHIYLRNCVFRI